MLLCCSAHVLQQCALCSICTLPALAACAMPASAPGTTTGLLGPTPCCAAATATAAAVFWLGEHAHLLPIMSQGGALQVEEFVLLEFWGLLAGRCDRALQIALLHAAPRCQSTDRWHGDEIVALAVAAGPPPSLPCRTDGCSIGSTQLLHT